MAGAAPGTTFGVDFILSGSWSSWSCQTATSFVFIGPKMPDASFKPSKPSETCQTGSWSCQTIGCGRPKLFFSTGPKLPDAPFKRFKPCEAFPVGSWSCQLWQASETCETGSWRCQLWQAKSFRCYWPETAGCSLQTLQILRNFQPGSWSCQLWQAKSFLFYWPETAGWSLFKRFKPSETFQTGSWSCQLWQAKSFLFYWPETAGCSLQTLQTVRNLANRLLVLPRNLPNRLLELPNYGLWQAMSVLFYWPETARCYLQTLQTLRNLPNQLLELPNSGCGRPGLSSLLARNCRMLPSNAPNSPKPVKQLANVLALPELAQLFPRRRQKADAECHGVARQDCRIDQSYTLSDHKSCKDACQRTAGQTHL